ncbi:MAG TPA: hypothetical protein PL123_05390 [Bacteroidales bacterium]|nr:hypothetical protein [Bacteroidales bacterium]
MKRLLSAFIISNMLFISSYGQESYIKGRWNIKAGYSVYKTQFLYSSKSVDNNNYRLELNYGLLNKIETGIYAGYSRFMIYDPWISGPPGSFVGTTCNTSFYGINCNYHLLPHLIKADDFRFDLYLSGKYGGISIKRHGNHPEYSLGTGVAFYLFRHIGAYAEYSYGKFYNNDNFKLRYGISLKF